MRHRVLVGSPGSTRVGGNRRRHRAEGCAHRPRTRTRSRRGGSIRRWERYGAHGRRHRLGISTHTGLWRRTWPFARAGSGGEPRGDGSSHRGRHVPDVRVLTGSERTPAERDQSGRDRTGFWGMDDHRRGSIRFDGGPPLRAESTPSLLLSSPQPIVMTAGQRDYVASSARRSEGSPAPHRRSERRRTVKNMAANKPMKLTVACGARSSSASTLLQNWYAAYNGGDHAGVAALFTTDAAVHDGAPCL